MKKLLPLLLLLPLLAFGQTVQYPRLDGDNTFTGNNTFNGTTSFGNATISDIGKQIVTSSSQMQEDFSRFPNATISTSGVAVGGNSTITTTSAHGLTTGDMVGIADHTGSTPDINGQHTVTVTSNTTFTISQNVTVGGTGGITGKVVRSEELPLIGGAWRQSLNGVQEYPFATPYGLKGATGTLLYMGTQESAPLKSYTFLIHYRQSKYPSVIGLGSITIATSASPLLNASGNGIYLPGRMLHMQINRGGDISLGLGTGAGGVNWSSPTTSQSVFHTGTNQNSGIPYGATGMYRIELEPGVMRVYCPGVTHTYTDTRFNDELAGANWWMEFGADYTRSAEIISSSVGNPTTITTSGNHGITNGQTIAIDKHSGSTPSINGTHVATVTSNTTFTISANVTVAGTGGGVGNPVKETPYFQRVWINTPVLDILPGIGSQPRSSILDALSSSGSLALPQNYTFNGTVTMGAAATFRSTVKRFDSGYGNFNYAFIIPAFTTEIASSANATAQSLVGLGDRVFTTNGSYLRHTVTGRFGATANNKQLVVDAPGVGTIFDSGVVNHNDKDFKLEIINMRTASFPKRYTTTFTCNGTTTMSRATWGFSSSVGPSVRATGTAAGDITIWQGITEVFYND
jgi:hypothetical protein